MERLEEYISTPMEETYGEGAELFRAVEFGMKYGTDGTTVAKNLKVDDELGLEIVEKPSIYVKYGVKCDPKKNSFHRSLYDQYMQRGTLSEKQINALRRSY